MSGLREVEPGSWDGELARLGLADVYLQRDYVESACLLDPGNPAFLHLAESGGDVVFGCIVRELPAGGADVTTPYGYGGPVAVGQQPPVERFWELYERWCAENEVVSSFVRFHPLYANQRYAPRAIRRERLAGTVGWRLAEGDLFARMHRSHRNKCRKAERAGVTITVEPEPESLEEFAALWEATMLRLEAADFYFFPDPYWEFLTSRLRDRLVRFDAHLEGELVASSLCLATRPWLHYHLGATGDRAREVGASNLVLYEAARWGQEHGFEQFHLGGGVGGRDDSLFAFKRGFDSDGVRESWIGKAVHDAAAYRALSGREASDLSGFFPAYRVPGAFSQTAGTPKRT